MNNDNIITINWSKNRLIYPDSSGSMSIDWSKRTMIHIEEYEKMKRDEIYQKRKRIIEKLLTENE